MVIIRAIEMVMGAVLILLEDARSAAAVMCARNGMQGMASRHGAELQAGQEGM